MLNLNEIKGYIPPISTVKTWITEDNSVKFLTSWYEPFSKLNYRMESIDRIYILSDSAEFYVPDDESIF